MLVTSPPFRLSHILCLLRPAQTQDVGARLSERGRRKKFLSGFRPGIIAKRQTMAIKLKPIMWSEEKNRRLREERGVCFEDVVLKIETGDVLDLLEHPNQERYPGQRIFVVEIDGYVYLVPFVETEEEVFLKTVIPSRKATRKYLGKEGKS